MKNLGSFHRIRKISQFGMLSIEVMLALIISSIAAVGALQASLQADHINLAEIQGGQLKKLRDAVESYSQENFANLQVGSPVSKNGVTLVNGTAAGQSFNPSIQNLIDMGYLESDFSTQGSFANVGNPGNYAIVMQRTPTGCVAGACNITGHVYLTAPILAPRSPTVGPNWEPDGPALSAMAMKIGENGGFTTLMTPGQITWLFAPQLAPPAPPPPATPNPVAGNPPGVIAARFGFLASGLGNFVRINDPRDPNLQGVLTVQGNITSKANVGSTDAAGCLRAALQADGQVLARQAAGCLTRAFMDPNTATAGVTDATGTSSVTMDGTSGRVTALRGRYNVSAVPGTACVGMDGDIVSDSTTDGGLLVCRAGRYVATSGAALGGLLGGVCVGEGAIARNIAPGAVNLLVCRSGIYQETGGLNIVTAGPAACVEGTLAKAASGVAMICQNNNWISLMNRMGYLVFVNAYEAIDSTSIPKPTCTGGFPRIYLIPKSSDAVGYMNYYAVDAGTYWVAYIRDGVGSPISGYAIAQAYCYYP